VVYLLIGALLGGAINVAVQLFLRRVHRARERRLAARVLLGEMSEIASARINSETGFYEARPLHEAWRQHRAALTDLGADDWQCLDDAVMSIVYPEQHPPGRPSGNPLTPHMDNAFFVLERHADLPPSLRHYEGFDY
jgi:hypothetical protein